MSKLNEKYNVVGEYRLNHTDIWEYSVRDFNSKGFNSSSIIIEDYIELIGQDIDYISNISIKHKNLNSYFINYIVIISMDVNNITQYEFVRLSYIDDYLYKLYEYRHEIIHQYRHKYRDDTDISFRERLIRESIKENYEALDKLSRV